MRKEKKGKSVEELLEEALVPEEEQPYKVPDNWIWVHISNFISLERGITFPSNAKKLQYEEGLIACARTANIQEEFNWDDLIYVDQSYMKKNQKKLIQKNDILMSISNSYPLVGKVSFISDVKKVTTFGGFLMCIRPKKVDVKFIYYYFRYLFLSGKIQQIATQTTNIANINAKKLNRLPLQLPPLTEQKRIAEKIERLLNKIDEAQRLIQEAKETFALRRSAILDKAFRGELTKKWREGDHDSDTDYNNQLFGSEERPYSLPKGWKWTSLEEACEKITDGTHHSPKSYPTGDYIYITAKNIKESGMVLKDVTYVSKEVHKEIYSRCDVKKGDVLYIKDGATTGIATINQLSEEFFLLSSVCVLRTKKDVILPDYLMFCLNSPTTKRRMLGMMSGNAIRRLTLKKIKQGIIPLPPMDEQQVIVSILRKVRDIDKKLDWYSNVDQKIEELKHSILSKAFRGELGTNDPSEKNAIELLKEVLQEQVKS